MLAYLLRRLILLPITLLSILLINFALINLAPGDPVTVSDISAQGMKRQDRSFVFGSDERWLQFREHYGLTLPIFFNSWPWLTKGEIETTLWQLIHYRASPESAKKLTIKEHDALRLLLGDQSPFVMDKLLAIVNDEQLPLEERTLALHFFVRGGTKQVQVAPTVSAEKRKENQAISAENSFLQALLSNQKSFSSAAEEASAWYAKMKQQRLFEPDTGEKIKILFFDTRISRYLSRIFTLDFGTMRNDSSKKVIDEVIKRLKYSLTLSLTPLVATFFLCIAFGMAMAVWQNTFFDHTMNLFFLILYALPVFVVAPWLIETLALRHTFPFTSTAIPLSGFTSQETLYSQMSSLQRLLDVFAHLALPLLAVMYGSFAAQTRLARTAILEVSKQDYVRTAKAKGLPPSQILFKHIGRNAAITIVTSLASSLGVVLGGSLIVETLFEIDGFGKFFYDAIINRDYNVILFSALAGSVLSLLGYLFADIAYTWLDPRLSLEEVQ